MPGGWSEGQGHHQARHTQQGEGGRCLDPHLGADDGHPQEEEVDCNVAQNSTKLVETPENAGVPGRGLLAGVDGEESSLASVEQRGAKAVEDNSSLDG